jgi:hypothetical protein
MKYFTDAPGQTTQTWDFKAGPITLADALSSPIWPGPSGNYLLTRDSWLRAGRYHEMVGGGIDSWAFGIRQLASGTVMRTLAGTFYHHRVGHDSAWSREGREGGTSLKALQVLMPFLDLLEEESVEYLMSKEGRVKWFGEIETRPIRVKAGAAGTGGTTKQMRRKRSLLTRVRFKLASLIYPH